MTDGLLLVTNSSAGSSEDEEIEAALTVLRRSGQVQVTPCDGPEDLDQAIDRLDGSALVVAGGDGSLHLAVNRLHEKGRLADVTVGLIPLGTGNDFARGLGVPLDPADAARACIGGGVRRLDLATTDLGPVMVNASHAGLGAIAAEKSERLKPRLGPLSYPLGALLAGVTESGYQLEVAVDGQVVSDGPTLMVGIANGPSIGGGTMLAPGALPDDGLLDVVVVTAVGPIARAAFGAALRKGEHLERDDVLHRRGREVRLTGDPVPHDMDGELLEGRERVTYTVVPDAWQFLAGSPSRTLR